MSELEQSLRNGPVDGIGSPAPGKGRKRILLVEDEALTRIIVLNRLRRAGFEVDFASTGKLALEKLRNQTPDALFLDLLLPDIPGVEVIAEARKDAKFGARPIYVCTSAVLMGVWTRRASKAGATKVFNKLSTRIEDIVAEVARDMLGEAPVAATLNSMLSANAAPPVPTGAPAEVKDHVAELCTDLQSLAACHDKETRATKCGELRDKAHSVASGAAVVQMHHLATTATALESLLKELGEKPKLVTESSLRTISSAVEVIDQLSHGDAGASEEKPPEFTAVVVDDGLVSRTTISNALRRTNFKTTTFSDTRKALAHLREQPADLVVLDVRLSQPDGFDLSQRLRELPAHQKTPVVFVGSARDLKRSSQAPSTNPAELVTKPFISMELSLKALSMVLKNRTPNRPDAPAIPAPVASIPPIVAPDPVAQGSSASTAPMATPVVNVAPGFRPDQPILQVPASPSEDSNLPPASGGNAVMELNEAAKIVSADEACALMFGWQSAELVGQDAGILFHAGLENELGRFLQRPGAPERDAAKPSFKVLARRKDGTEFPAAVTLEPRLEGAQFCWTAVFQPLPASEISALQTVIIAPPEMRLAHGQSPALAEALARLHQSQATLQSANEELHRQFQAISAEAAMHRDELAKNEKERQELAQRIYANEIERTRAQAALTQEVRERQQLEQTLQDIKAAKADLEKQFEARSQSNEELGQTCRQIREQLEEAKSTNDRAETIRQQELARASQLEENLASLRRAHEELNSRLTAEQQAVAESTLRNQDLESRARESGAELERVKAELEKQSAEREQSESQWREQLATGKAATEKAEAAWLEESERTKRFEEELAGLRNLRDELNGKLAAEQQAEEALKEKTAQSTRLEQELTSLRQERQDLHERYVAEQQEDLKSKRRIKELERHLREGANSFAGVKVELEKRAVERERLSAELQEQLEAAKASAQQAEAAHQAEIARRTRLEEELTGLRQMHDELSGKFSADRETAAESNQRIEALESRLRENAAELARAKSTLESHAAERAQLESEHRNFAGNAEDLGLEMCRLRENEAAHRAELSELERRIREGVASLARVTADLEKERGERRRVEQRSATLAAQLQDLHGELRQHLESEKATQQRITDLEQQLHEREHVAARVQSDLQRETAERQLAEEQLKAVGDMSAQLRKYLSLFEESKKVFKRTQEDLESRLQTSLKAVGETDSKLQKEASERQRLEEALASAQRSLHEQTEKGALELSRLQSELQVEQFERKRLEGDAVHSRYASLDSARVGRGLVNSLRREIRQPVDTLLRTTRRLLEVELPDEQKKLVESVLENALLVQTSLQETGTLTGGSSRANDEGQPESQSPRPTGLVAEKPVGDVQP